jgi:hypothetical protein
MPFISRRVCDFDVAFVVALAYYARPRLSYLLFFCAAMIRRTAPQI